MVGRGDGGVSEFLEFQVVWCPADALSPSDFFLLVVWFGLGAVEVPELAVEPSLGSSLAVFILLGFRTKTWRCGVLSSRVSTYNIFYVSTILYLVNLY